MSAKYQDVSNTFALTQVTGVRVVRILLWFTVTCYLRFFSPWSKIREFSVAYIGTWTTVQQVLQVAVWMESMSFCHFYHDINNHARIGSGLTVAEHPVFASRDYRSNRVFRCLFAYVHKNQNTASDHLQSAETTSFRSIRSAEPKPAKSHTA